MREGPQPTKIVGQKEGIASLLCVHANNGRDDMYSWEFDYEFNRVELHALRW